MGCVDPKVKEFLIFSFVLLVVLVAYMLYRPKKQPSRLKLRDSKDGGKVDFSSLGIDVEGFEDGDAPSTAKEINIIFQFNGHSFEAYEVLGLPAGSSLREVEKAYRDSLNEKDMQAQEILHFAYRAILKKNS